MASSTIFRSGVPRLALQSSHLSRSQVPNIRSMASMSRPTGLIANKGIELLTLATPNGVKASIILEELKAAYGLEYTWQGINIMENIQKEPWFTALNPNGRIPVIVDHDNDKLAVFEGNAILSYLTRKYDPDHKFSFAIDDNDYTRAESWVGWQHGGIGPMQGQAGHFVRYAKERVPYGIQRYVGETERLYGILDARLKDRNYVVGPGRGKYSIADISMVGWVNSSPMAGVDINQFPNVRAWLDRIVARPAVQKGLSIPAASQTTVAAMEKRLAEGEAGLKEKEDAVKEEVAAAKKAYNYVYTSP